MMSNSDNSTNSSEKNKSENQPISDNKIHLETDAQNQDDSQMNEKIDASNQSIQKKLIIDPSQSIIHWEGFKPGGSHTGTLSIKEGEVILENDLPRHVSVTMDMNSIQDLDLKGMLATTLVKDLKGKSFFNVEEYPILLLSAKLF